MKKSGGALIFFTVPSTIDQSILIYLHSGLGFGTVFATYIYLSLSTQNFLIVVVYSSSSSSSSSSLSNSEKTNGEE